MKKSYDPGSEVKVKRKVCCRTELLGELAPLSLAVVLCANRNPAGAVLPGREMQTQGKVCS